MRGLSDIMDRKHWRRAYSRCSINAGAAMATEPDPEWVPRRSGLCP